MVRRADTWTSAEDAKFRDNVASIRASLEEIASLATFVRKWTPWLIAVVGVAYPTLGKIIQSVPFPH